MIRRVEALSFRSLRYVSQEMSDFHLLVGPNASGKTTFLDVIALLGDLLRDGLEMAVRSRSPDLVSLIWMERGDRFELAVEMEIPPEQRTQFPRNGQSRARYEVAIGLDPRGELTLLGENLWLRPQPPGPAAPVQRSLFPRPPDPPNTIVIPQGRKTPIGWRTVVSKRPESGNDYFLSEVTGWNNQFRLGPQKSALANLPEDEERFPVAIWAKRFLIEGVRRLVLNSEAMRRPSPPGSPTRFQLDGSNLAWVVESLRAGDREMFERWIRHVRTALPDLRTVETVVREEDRHRYLRVVYATGLKAPSWAVSDGTLRLLALTILAYLPERNRIFLIEEPENGIHPSAVETVFQSLSSTYDSQILCASHSPVVLSLATPEQVLCFARDTDGATDIVRGHEHPNLQNWQGDSDLGMLLAAGVLG